MNTLRSLLFTTLCLSMLGASAQLKPRPAHVGLVYPISTNGVQARQYSNEVSLHAFAGVSGAETGFALAGICLIVDSGARGLQASGLVNRVGGYANGMQLAGFLNMAGSSRGLAAAGFGNISRDSSGSQLSGFFNRAKGVRGLQAAGFINIAKDVQGVQTAGFVNIAANVRGAQAAGFVNIAKDARGLQAAGFINRSADVDGIQAAGVINIAKKVHGVQIAGFINIADSCDYPIALLNFIRGGEKSLGFSYDETGSTLLTFRSGGRKLYSLVGVGYNGRHGDSLFVWQAGFGMHFPLNDRFRINTEAVTTGMTDFKREDYFRATLRVFPAFVISHRVELFAGPSVNYIRTERGRGNNLVSHYFWKERESSGLFHGLYFGVSCGINVIL